MKNVQECPLCLKPLALVSELSLGDEKIRSFKCGHTFSDTVLKFNSDKFDFESVDRSKRARDYQKEGVEFIFNAGFNCVIGDQMRLGKTPQSLLALKNSPEHFPALIVVRSANLYQWTREFKTWVTSELWGIFPIVGSKNFIPPGFKAYIISMDTFSRKGMMETLLAFGFRLVIVDEAHSFKNTDSNRSQALIAFLKNINRADLEHEVPFTCMMCKHTWTEHVTVKVNTMEAGKSVSKTTYCPSCKAKVTQKAGAHVKVKRNCDCVMLTGTAIKNRADEYFVPLNIIAPERFPQLSTLQQEWLIQNDKGKFTRVAPWKYEAFKETIAPFVLRREKEDVYKDLPPLNRIFTVMTVDDQRMKDAYNRVLGEMEESLVRNPTFFDSIGALQRLRQICGMAKVKWTADYAETLMMDSDKLKFAVGIHHHAVRDSIAYELSQHGVMKLSGEDSAEQKDRVMVEFEKAPERILVINMLAGGVGMDFHYIDYALILERQWSAADEEQFEFRFYNPDKSIKDRSTTIEYVVAKGTIDEWFYELVEEKRTIFGETIGTNWNLQEDTKSWRRLLEQTVSNRL